MAWGDSPSAPVIEAMQGWFDTPPDVNGEPVTGWWAALDLDNQITVQFIPVCELLTFTGWDLVTHISVNRNTVLRAVRKIAAARGLTVTMNMGLGGTFYLAAGADINVQRLAGLGLVHDISTSLTVTDTSFLNMFTELNFQFVRGITVNRSNGLAKVGLLSTARTFTVNRLATLGFIVGLSAAQQVNVNRAASLGFPPNAPLLQQMTASGNYTIPRWSNFIAMVALGGGGGGQASAAFFTQGKGGYNGEYGSGTVERGNHVPYSQLTFAVTIGAGGAQGVWDGVGAGKPGEDTVINYGTGSVVGVGGAGGFGFGSNDGEAAGNLNYDGISAVGGGTQTGNANGLVPGGGGAGSPQLSSGYAGARGQAWFRAYQ